MLHTFKALHFVERIMLLGVAIALVGIWLWLPPAGALVVIGAAVTVTAVITAITMAESGR